MEYFIFNDISSNDMNIIVKEMPPIIRPEQRINKIKLVGRSGSLHEVEDKYDSFNTTIKCILSPSADIDEIKSWLRGSGKIILSTNRERYYNVTIVNKIDFTKYLTYLREFSLELEFEPISYDNKLNNIEIGTNKEINYKVSGNYKTYPLLEITGTGIITCNGKSIVVNENNNIIYIDCELQNAYYGTENKNSCVNGLEDPLYLSPGDNLITTVGLSATIKYRSAWL